MKLVIELRNKILKSLLFSRFEPIETVLSISAAVHGGIILFYSAFFGISLLNINNAVEVFAGGALVISSASVIRSLCKEYAEVRRFSAFGQFLSWLLLAALVSISESAISFLHIGYATLAIVSAFVYLNLSVGDQND